MEGRYPGPLRDEPLAVELHNTLYASAGVSMDGIETSDGLRAWLAGIADRLPAGARATDPSRHPDFLALRAAVREALRAALEGEPVPAAALAVVNEFAARAPVSPFGIADEDGVLKAETRHHATDPSDIALAVIAADTIRLLGPGHEDLRACGAPGCVLTFLKSDPRQRWCSELCGNRARQARHYHRTRHARRKAGKLGC